MFFYLFFGEGSPTKLIRLQKKEALEDLASKTLGRPGSLIFRSRIKRPGASPRGDASSCETKASAKREDDVESSATAMIWRVAQMYWNQKLKPASP